MRVLGLIALAMLSGACGDGGSGPSNPSPTAAAIEVGDDFFRSGRNSTEDPAVDTLAVNGTVTWTWAADSRTHSVQSLSGPGFADSEELAGGDSRYEVTLTAPGTTNTTAASTGGP
ncbi:MAG: hypothetical protein H0W29_11185 [Gemmatimonadales bacterium]|nr:hypothetical protein [Gemmatimonadales bacterium]